jgi:type I restriction enzyme S subunit
MNQELLKKQAHITFIPEAWKLTVLNTILTVEPQNGYSPNCPDEPNGKWVLGLGNLTESGFNPSNAKPAPIDDSLVENFLLSSGDFIVSRSNTPDKVGRAALFRGEIPNCSYPDLMMRFRVDEALAYPDFIEKVLISTNTKTYYKAHSAGSSSTMVKINKSVVNKTPLLLPPLPEQKAIADLLSTWDSAIEKTERLIAAKEKRFQWLLDELISKPSREGKWKEVPLSSICKIKKGFQLNVSDMIEEGKFYALNGGITPSGRTNEWNTPENTITISEGGNSCGFVSFNTEKFWAGGHLYSLVEIKSQKIHQKYLYHFLKNIEPRIMKLRVGSGLPNIQKKDVDNIMVMLPNVEDQSGIALILDDVQKEIDILKSLADKYKEHKRGLMQKLLTGEWRVKVRGKYE